MTDNHNDDVDRELDRLRESQRHLDQILERESRLRECIIRLRAALRRIAREHDGSTNYELLGVVHVALAESDPFVPRDK